MNEKIRSIGAIVLSILLVKSSSVVGLGDVKQVDPDSPPDPFEGKTFSFFASTDTCIDNRTRRIVNNEECERAGLINDVQILD